MQKIIYGIHETEFGQAILAKSDAGLFWFGFMTTKEEGAYKGDGLSRLQRYQLKYYPNAQLSQDNQATHSLMNDIMKAWKDGTEKSIALDLQGTDFEKQVWQSLLNISKGSVKTYSEVANDIKRPRAMRAVGTAVGENPVSLIVPCHRVLPSAGGVGNYGWGPGLKKTILEKENIFVKNA